MNRCQGRLNRVDPPVARDWGTGFAAAQIEQRTAPAWLRKPIGCRVLFLPFLDGWKRFSACAPRPRTCWKLQSQCLTECDDGCVLIESRSGQLDSGIRSRPMRWKSPGSSRFDALPSTVACPRLARRMFISRRITVVLPAPLAPMSANTEPSGTRKSRSSTASRRPIPSSDPASQRSFETTLSPRSSVHVSSTACCNSLSRAPTRMASTTGFSTSSSSSRLRSPVRMVTKPVRGRACSS